MIVDTEKVLREPEESDSTKKSASGGKVFAPGCARGSVPEKPAGSLKSGMSSNWTCSSKLCFLKKLPQFFPWGNPVRIMGIHTAGSSVKNHISSEWQEN